MTKTVRKKYTKSAQKVQKKVQKEFFYFADIYVCDNFVVFFCFISFYLIISENQEFLHH